MQHIIGFAVGQHRIKLCEFLVRKDKRVLFSVMLRCVVPDPFVIVQAFQLHLNFVRKAVFDSVVRDAVVEHLGCK